MEQLLSYLMLAYKLYGDGRLTFDKIRGYLSEAGATDAELAASDAMVEAEIARRKAEHGL